MLNGQEKKYRREEKQILILRLFQLVRIIEQDVKKRLLMGHSPFFFRRGQKSTPPSIASTISEIPIERDPTRENMAIVGLAL